MPRKKKKWFAVRSLEERTAVVTYHVLATDEVDARDKFHSGDRTFVEEGEEQVIDADIQSVTEVK